MYKWSSSSNMNLVEWGNEFPTSGNIRQLLHSITHFPKKLINAIRTLNGICFCFENSYLILPIQSLEKQDTIRSIKNFIDNGGEAPDSILYNQDQPKIIDLISFPSPGLYNLFLIFRENFTFDSVRVTNEGQIFHQSNTLTINEGILRRVFIQNGIISLLTQNGKKYNIYSAKFSSLAPITKWGIQCEVDSLCDIYTLPPILYIIKQDGVYGCALDDAGNRRFPRPLNEIFIQENLKFVHSLKDFYVFKTSESELYRIQGKTIKKVCKLNTSNLQNLVCIQGQIFTLSKDSINLYDLLSGESVSHWDTPETAKWIVSIDESYGIVFIGEKSYTISKYNIPPLINLYADKKELVNTMNKVMNRTGTVAAPILQLANRSPVLAVSLLEKEIREEVKTHPAENTLQSAVRPSLIKLVELINEKPIENA